MAWLKPSRRRRVWIHLSLWLALASLGTLAETGRPPETLAPLVLLPRQALGPEELGVIVNDRDPRSRRIAREYRAKRRIPPENLIHVSFPPHRRMMTPERFQAIHARVKAATPERVQAYALTWTEPYRVGCMSITTAFAAGYDESFCADGCRTTKSSPYFASASQRPFTDFGWRPTMALAGSRLDAVRALIDRGVASDDTRPTGTVYLVKTSDAARSVRAQTFSRVEALFGTAIRIERVEDDSIAHKPDVLVYLTGAVRVPEIATNQFLPGAIADHLTSTGGQLTDSRQMSSLDWLDAGATGSYGSVVEPCNFPAKFPDPVILIGAYLSGATLIEAYWKSLLMPGQGILIGEPLARPFGGHELTFDGAAWVLKTFALLPGRYRLESADQPMGPYRPVGAFVKPDANPLRLRLPTDGKPYYRVVAAEADLPPAALLGPQPD
ncbi:TIGR03790 family protein [Thiocystis minor]|uniref:TIGR03790 family protein n=1 Tax=Thiocystis minor TaxID=61597 RepID=UPI0019145AC7|nr:TIGR03790 family protein [Thiocystis minor]MBK5966097.1 TIGR03790 family protein [Thiocystis minor]